MRLLSFIKENKMYHMRMSPVFFRLAAGLCLTSAVAFCASATASLRPGKAELKSAGQLTFGPDGVLFVGDALGAAVYAIDTEDTKPVGSVTPVEVKAINEKIAALLGAMPDQILINDIKVNPISKKIYLSVSRGRGPDAAPVILRMDAAGRMNFRWIMSTIRWSLCRMRLSHDPRPRPSRAANASMVSRSRSWARASPARGTRVRGQSLICRT
jgi:hypothetical protein